MMKKTQLILQELDFFSCPIGLHMNKSFFYKTSLGGLSSILAVVFILSFLWSRISSFYSKDEVKVVTNRVYSPNPPQSSLSPDRFMFALRIYQDNRDFITRPYFNITVVQGIYEMQGDTQIRNFFNIELEPCTNSHWESMKGYANFTKLFESFGNDYLCPSQRIEFILIYDFLQQQMYIQGMFGSQVFSFLEIKVMPCISPNDSSMKWNPTCAPQNEVDLITKRDGFHGMNIYHSNYVLNTDQPSDFFTPYINDKLYFTFVPYQMTQLCDIYFQDISVVNDESLMPNENNQNFKFLTQENNDIRETTQLSRKDGIFVVLTLRLSPYVSVINRSYKKISQLLSELGGFIQIVLACLGLLMRRYNNFQFTVDIANNLYSFDINNKDSQNSQTENQIQDEVQVLSYPQDSSRPMTMQATKKRKKSSLQKDSCQDGSSNEQRQEKNQTLILSSNNIQSNNQILSKPDLVGVKESVSNGKKQGLKQKAIQSEKQIKKSKDEQKMNLFDNQMVADLDEQEQQGKQNQQSYLVRQFKRILQSQQKLQVGLKYFMSKFTLSKLFNSEYNQYITKATNMIHSDLDICNILEKLQSIEKIKNILFDNAQKTVFDFFPKPLISLNAETDQISPTNCQATLPQQANLDAIVKSVKSCEYEKGILNERNEYHTLDQYKKLFGSYLALKSNSYQDSKESDINDRLIKYLGSDILKIFQFTEQLDDSSYYEERLQEKLAVNIQSCSSQNMVLKSSQKQNNQLVEQSQKRLKSQSIFNPNLNSLQLKSVTVSLNQHIQANMTQRQQELVTKLPLQNEIQQSTNNIFQNKDLISGQNSQNNSLDESNNQNIPYESDNKGKVAISLEKYNVS